jgi:hypothetical protein
MMKKQIIILAMTATISSGCVAKNSSEQQQADITSLVGQTLLRAVEESRADLSMLARARGGPSGNYAASGPKGTRPVFPLPDAALSREISMSWIGPANTALRELCRQIDYRFEENGRRHVQYPSVVVSAVDKAAYNILESLSWQVLPTYVLSIDTTRRVVTLSGTDAGDAVPPQETPNKKRRW